MKKKISLILVGIILMQIILPLWESIFTIKSMAAAVHEEKVGNITWTYELEYGNAINVKPKDKNEVGGNVVIPKELNGYPVASIDSIAFQQYTQITSVEIQEGVTSIGSFAFTGCRGLTSIVIPEGLTTIEEGVFNGCSNLKNITIPNSVTSIGMSAFWGCEGLTSITIPEGVESIEQGTFWGCSGLTEITIPNTIKKIGGNAFKNCSGLTSITIPSGVTNIEDVFSNCSSLTSISVEEGNQRYSSESGVLCRKDKTQITLIRYPAEKVGTTYVIPDSVTSIEDYAFENCSKLESIVIPDSVTSIGTNVFDGCSSLTSITVEKGNQKYRSQEGVLCMKDGTLIRYPTGKADETYIIPEGVTLIGNYAFKGCSKLGNITIPNSVTGIGDNAFYGCSSLESVTISNRLTLIGDSAFNECDENVTIYCKEGSSAKTYAINNNINYGIIGVAGIAVKTNPRKVDYKLGETLNTEGLELTVTYDKGDTEEIAEGYSCTPTTLNTVGTQEITVTYGGKTATFNVIVKAKTLTGITLTKAPTKVSYIEGQNFNPAGMVVTATYNDGSTRGVTNYTVTDGNNLTVGKTSVTISYTENGITETATQGITVTAKALTEIKVTQLPIKTEYIEGQSFEPAGMKVVATYNDGTTPEIMQGFTCTPTVLNSAETQAITVTYGGRTATFNVTVIKKGDANGDDQVNFRDILVINNHRLTKSLLTGIYLEAADVTGDGNIDFGDILKVNRYRLEKIDSL